MKPKDDNGDAMWVAIIIIALMIEVPVMFYIGRPSQPLELHTNDRILIPRSLCSVSSSESGLIEVRVVELSPSHVHYLYQPSGASPVTGWIPRSSVADVLEFRGAVSVDGITLEARQ